MVQVFLDGDLVKTHAALEQGKRTDRNDYPPEKIAFQMRTPVWCRTQASEIGASCRELIDGLLEVNALYRLRAAQGVLGLRKKYPDATGGGLRQGHRRRRPVVSHGQGHSDRRHRDRSGAGPAGTPGRRRSCTARRLFASVATRTRRTTTATTRPGSEGCPMSVMDTALRESLKSLRLSGMLETLDARLAKPTAASLGTWSSCRSSARTRSPAARPPPSAGACRARFEQHVTLEEFDFTASSKLPAAQIRDLSALRWLHAGESVILFGPVGVGKTHVAQGLGHLAVRQGANVRFAKTSRILADLAGGHADRTWEKRVRELVRPDVLILDDFAMRQMTAPRPTTSTSWSANARAEA